MLKQLKNIERNRVVDTRNYEKGLLLNRAERVKRFTKTELKNIFNINNFSLGNYYNTNNLYQKISKYKPKFFFSII